MSHSASRSVDSFTLPATLPSVLLANPRLVGPGASALGHTGPCRREENPRGPPPPRPIPAAPCPVLRITLVREARLALTLSSLRIPSVACTYDTSPDT